MRLDYAFLLPTMVVQKGASCIVIGQSLPWTVLYDPHRMPVCGEKEMVLRG